MLLAMLAIAESHRVQQYVRLVNDADFNSGASASRADGASAKSSARNLELKAILADPRSVGQHMDILLSHMVGNPKLQEEIRTLSDEVEAMMANPLLQEQATLVAEQLEKVMMDADFKKQAEQLLKQAEEFVMQIQMMMTDSHLQGEAEWFAHQMEEGMSADGTTRNHANTLAKWTELVEKMMANPRLNEHARRLFKQLEAMKANQKFQDRATSFAQLMETLMADPNFQRSARRIAAHIAATLELTQEELARFVTKQMDILVTQMVGPKLQEEIRILIGEVGAMMADPLLQDQASLVAEQLEKLMLEANFQEQVGQLLEQAVQLVTQMQTIMTDPRLQGEAEMFAKQMGEAMSADGNWWDHATEVIMGNPRLYEHARRLSKQLESMQADRNFQDQFTPTAQLMESLMADPNFQRHARRIAAHMEAIRSHLTSQNMGGGPTADLFSLAEVDWSSTKVSFVPPLSRPASFTPLRSVQPPALSLCRRGCPPTHMAAAAAGGGTGTGTGTGTGSSLVAEANKPNRQGSAVYGLILLNFAIFVADKVLQVPALRALYLDHRHWAWWQPLTALFCHGSRSHLNGNVFLLLLFGRSVEDEVGAAGLVFFFCFCGVVANLVSLLLLPAATVSLGASGAVFGLFAVSTLAKLSWRTLDWRKLVELAVLGEFVIGAVASEIQTAATGGVAGINHVAHLSGAAAGAAIVWLLRSIVGRFEREEKKKAR